MRNGLKINWRKKEENNMIIDVWGWKIIVVDFFHKGFQPITR